VTTMAHALDRLPSFDRDGNLQVIIETPKGSRNKFKYEPTVGLFALSGVLPLGASFPFDFGFVPHTSAPDGDPLDVLVLMDEPAFVGCLLPTRLIGVIEAEQTEHGESTRNDRLIGVAGPSREHRDVQCLDDLQPNVLAEVEHFFVSYNAAKGKEFVIRARHGPERARQLVLDAQRAARRARRRS
jgi:inorganic pyrophosphatase